MTTPRKDFNYNSPYAQPIKQYPSQSEDYISLDMGGARQQYPTVSSNEKTPGHHNLKYYQQNFRNSNSKASRRNLLYNNYSQDSHRQSFNQQRYGSRNSSEWPSHQQNVRNSHEKRSQQQKNVSVMFFLLHTEYNKFLSLKVHNDNHDTKPISAYVHPSMTEDPWLELTQRLRALEKSQISFKDTSAPSNTSPTASSDAELQSTSSD